MQSPSVVPLLPKEPRMRPPTGRHSTICAATTFLAATTLTLGACRPADAPEALTTLPASRPPATPESHWQCDDHVVTTRFDTDAGTVILTHGRGQLVLPQAVSASGARYADANGNVFWTKGAAGTLTLSGMPERECTQSLAMNQQQPPE